MDHPEKSKGAAPEGREAPIATVRLAWNRDEARRAEARAICRRCIAASGLPLQFADVDVDRGRRNATVFFSSDAKVDFRELCRDLGRNLRMRVILHRLGPRDLAKRAGTCGPCGRALCCKSFLSAVPSVSVKLVKRQKFPLTPERSAGMCGRLKCCLAYETGAGACRAGVCGGCEPPG